MDKMKLLSLGPILIFLSINLRSTGQVLDPPFSVIQQDSVCEECLLRVLLPSHARHVYLLCAPESTFCPTSVLNDLRYTSWTLFRQKIFIENSYGNDFFVIAGDNATHILAFFEEDRYACETGGKFLLTFPSPASGDLSGLGDLFYAIWRAGKTDIVVVLTDWRCRIFSYVPIKGEDNYIRSTSPTLLRLWARNSSCILNESAGKFSYFRNEKIPNLQNCIIDVLSRPHIDLYGPLINFLQKEMRVSFNISQTTLVSQGSINIVSRSLPVIEVSIFFTSQVSGRHFILPPFFETEDAVYVVPRKLVSSVLWFRFINELSDYVWCGLIISLILSVGVFYLYLKRTKDFVYVTQFSVQTFFGPACSARLLPWRGRVFFTVWLWFCFVLMSSYVCTLHSELIVPNTEDAIKSFHDLIKSNLPVHVRMNSAFRNMFDASSYFHQIKHKLVELDTTKVRPLDFVKKDRRDIAYIIKSRRGFELFREMPYRLLPEVISTYSSFPVRMTRPSPYQEIFEMAVMRSLAAGALDKVSQDIRRRNFRPSGTDSLKREKVTKPLSLDSFDAMLIVWLSSCGISFLVFVVECWIKQIRRFMMRQLGTIR